MSTPLQTLDLGHGLTAHLLRANKTENSQIVEYGLALPQPCVLTDGHFPHMPIIPGIAQLMVFLLVPIQSVWPDLAQIKQVHSLKFLRALLPGDSLKLFFERIDKHPQIRFRIFHRDKICTRGSIDFYEPSHL